jgi:hypothetical protein
MKRGSDVHTACEEYLKAPVSNPLPCPPEALNFREQMESLRTEPGLHSEEEWAFRSDWSECGWFDSDAWFRAKVDVRFGARDKGILNIVDFKTGSAKRPPGPEVYEQAELYALAAFKKFGDSVRQVRVKFWYFDRPFSDNIREGVFEGGDVPHLADKWGVRAFTLTHDSAFDKTPGYFCRWCAFNAKKGGPCDGVPSAEVSGGGF